MNSDELNIPSKEAIRKADYILNHYSKDSQADIICLALAFDRQFRKSNNPHDGSNLNDFLLEEEYNKLKNITQAWQECAENLVDYAHEFVEHLSTWGKGYDRYDKQIEKAEDAIEQYYKLKNETQFI